MPFGALSFALERASGDDPAFLPGAEAMRAYISGSTAGQESDRLSFAQMCDVFARTLIEAGERDPACVVVDDVHLLDYESLALLGVALGRVAGHNVSFVCSTRSPGRDLGSHAAELLARLAEWPDVEELDLGPLAGDQGRELLEGVFGTPVSQAVADEVTRRSGGNPLFMLEMARSLSELDLVDAGAGGVAFRDRPGCAAPHAAHGDPATAVPALAGMPAGRPDRRRAPPHPADRPRPRGRAGAARPGRDRRRLRRARAARDHRRRQRRCLDAVPSVRRRRLVRRHRSCRAPPGPPSRRRAPARQAATRARRST